MRRLPVLFILFIASGLIFAEDILLKKINYYPKKEDDYYFRPLNDLEIIDSTLYAVENFRHKIVKFTIDNDQIKYLKDIGRQGQGPGDLMRPSRLSISNDEIGIIDEFGFSFFSLEGNFLRRFPKVSRYNRDFVCHKDKIFWVNFKPQDRHLIEVYSKEGKRLFEFGNRNLKIDYSSFQGRNPVYIETMLYEGYMLTDGKNIYYANPRFGELIKFSPEGKKLDEINVENLFGEMGRKALEENKRLYIEGGLNKIEDKRDYYYQYIFRDAYICNGKIFLLGSDVILGKGTSEKVRIIALSLETLKVTKEYQFPLGQDQGIYKFAVMEKERIPAFFISMHNEDGYLIAVYMEHE